MKQIILILLGLYLILPRSTQAEDDPLKGLRGLKSGNMLRVVADSLGPVSGRFDSLTTSSLHLGRYPFTEAYLKKLNKNYKPADILAGHRPLPGDQAVTLTKINSVHLRKTHGNTGGMIGFTVGAGLFLAFVKVHEVNDMTKQSTKETVTAVAIGGVLGGVTGVLLGSIFPKWVEVYKRP